MKKLVVGCFLCLVVVPGCFEPIRMRDEGQKQSAPPGGAASLPALARPPQVRPDSINEANAHAKAQELEAELNYDGQAGKTPP